MRRGVLVVKIDNLFEKAGSFLLVLCFLKQIVKKETHTDVLGIDKSCDGFVRSTTLRLHPPNISYQALNYTLPLS